MAFLPLVNILGAGGHDRVPQVQQSMMKGMPRLMIKLVERFENPPCIIFLCMHIIPPDPPSQSGN